MTTDFIELQQSFEELKQTARSDNDVLEWFRKHPETLPCVLAPLVPYLTVDFKGDRTFYLDDDEDFMVRRLKIVYGTDLPVTVGTDAFTKLTKMDCQRDGSKNPQPHQVLQFDMDPIEWRYVSVMYAHTILWCPDRYSEVAEAKAKLLWEHYNPDISWDILGKLHGNGLVPEDEAGFIAWACNRVISAQSEINLPSLIAMD